MEGDSDDEFQETKEFVAIGFWLAEGMPDVGIPGDDAQRPLFSSAADENRNGIAYGPELVDLLAMKSGLKGVLQCL